MIEFKVFDLLYNCSIHTWGLCYFTATLWESNNWPISIAREIFSRITQFQRYVPVIIKFILWTIQEHFTRFPLKFFKKIQVNKAFNSWRWVKCSNALWENRFIRNNRRKLRSPKQKTKQQTATKQTSSKIKVSVKN